MQDFIQKKYVKYHKGSGQLCCHVEALHAAPPAADRYTDNIVLGIMAQTHCAGIISTVSRQMVDLNKLPDGMNNEGVQEYRNCVRDILEHLGIVQENEWINRHYLHLSIHGMKDEHHGPFAIEVGTRNGQSCSKEMKKWLKETMIKKASEMIPGSTLCLMKSLSEILLWYVTGEGMARNTGAMGQNFIPFNWKSPIIYGKTSILLSWSYWPIRFYHFMKDFHKFPSFHK